MIFIRSCCAVGPWINGAPIFFAYSYFSRLIDSDLTNTYHEGENIVAEDNDLVFSSFMVADQELREHSYSQGFIMNCYLPRTLEIYSGS